MTNTTVPLNPTAAEVINGSPFSYPALVLDGLKAARRHWFRDEIGNSLQTTMTELIALGLVAQTVNRARGFRPQLSLTAAGKARMVEVNRVSIFIASRPVDTQEV